MIPQSPDSTLPPVPSPHRKVGGGHSIPPALENAHVVKSHIEKRLIVTVHRAVNLPAMDSDGFSDPYATLHLKHSKGAVKETRCIRTTLNPVWEDTFEFDFPNPADTLIVDVYDRDWLFGVPLKPDYIGRVVVDVQDSAVSTDNVTLWYPIRDTVHDRMIEGRVLISHRIKVLEVVEKQESFWSMLKKGGENRRFHRAADHGTTTLSGGTTNTSTSTHDINGDDQDVEGFRNLFPHLRPIIGDSFVFLYYVIRPALLFLLWHRRILMDWEKPGMAACFLLVFFWSWWHHVQLGVCAMYLALRLLWYVLTRERPPVEGGGTNNNTNTTTTNSDTTGDEPSLPEMVEAFKAAKAELLYQPIDPLIQDFERVDWALKEMALRAQLLHDNLYVFGDQTVVLSVGGTLVLLSVLCLAAPSFVSLLLLVLIRYATLALVVRYFIVLPFQWRYPTVVPQALSMLAVPLRRTFKPLHLWWRKHRQLRLLTKAEQDDGKPLTRTNLKPTDWELLCRDVGHRVKLRRGHLLEETGHKIDKIYRLVKGKLEMRDREQNTASVMLNAPSTVFAANMLFGHGVITHSFVAYVRCTLYEFDVEELRMYFHQHPFLWERFYLDLAVDIASEVKYLMDKIVVGKNFGPRAPGESNSMPRASIPNVKTRPAAGPNRAQEIFSMSAQDLGVFDPREVENVAKMSRFYQDTFHEKVDPKFFHVFHNNLWIKRGWTRFPGRLFVTPKHIAFWSQVGGKKIFFVPSRGATVESWKVPIGCLTALSRHEDDLHVKLTFDLTDADVEESLAGMFMTPPGKKKVVTVTVHSDNMTLLGNLTRAVQDMQKLATPEPASPRSNRKLLEGSADNNNNDVSDLDRSVAGGAFASWQNFGASLHGVELTAGTILVQADEWERQNVFFSLFTDLKKGMKKLLVPGAAPHVQNSVVKSVGKSKSSLEQIMEVRSSVLTPEDRFFLLGKSEEDRESILIFSPGEMILKKGEFYERALFHIVQGECRFRLGSEQIGSVKEGEIFGEIGFFLSEPLAMSVVASTKCEVRQMKVDNLQDQAKKFPGFGGRLYEFLSYVLINRLHVLASMHANRMAATLADETLAEVKESIQLAGQSDVEAVSPKKARKETA